MRSSWLYLAMRSERDSEPVLIWPALVPTAMSAMVESSVSPERCEIDRGVAGALGHLDRGEGLGQRADLVDLDQDRVGDAFCDAFLQDLRVGHEQVVADQLHAACRAARSGSFQPSQSSSAMPSSMLMIGYLSHQVASMSVELAGVERQAFGLERGTRRPCRTRWPRSRGRARSASPGRVAGLVDRLQDQLRARLRGLAAFGAKPPSSPTAVGHALARR